MTALFLSGGGEAGELVRAVDWSKTQLGPPETWSQALRSTVALVLNNSWQLLLWWGPELTQIYNDAYTPVLGNKHPRAMGQRFADCWAEVFHILGPMAQQPYDGGAATTRDDIALAIDRRVPREESHFRLAYSPVPDETVPKTGIGGVLATVTEITERVYSERQLRTLRELAAHTGVAHTPEQACELAAATLVANTWDVPFALFYLVDETGSRAVLAACAGMPREAVPAELELQGRDAWRVADVVRDHAVAMIDHLAHAGDALPRSPWNDLPTSAIALPLAPYGVVVCGTSPHRLLDDRYRAFFELAAAQTVSSIQTATAYAEEQRRAEQLAALDRAKTMFFSNVSHELRTPLTLILGPTEDALAVAPAALAGANLETVHRNALRLLRLVNTLLDFSRIEAGRVQPTFEPTDLAELTRALASTFDAAIARGGLRYEIDCAPVDADTYVDRDMWEKIVLNLLSNAFKFTFDGGIRVSLRRAGEQVVLEVADTGIGIAASELPHVFERFHRIEDVRSRTNEGSGIGLALVHDLVELHGGTIEIASELGKGTAIRVAIPIGRAHVAPDQVGDRREASAPASANAFALEAMRWVEPGAPTPGGQTGARVLVADDNVDMRDYVARLLRAHGYAVEAVADGDAALASARREPPDLVLCDIMMPRLDGFGLIRALRDDPVLAPVPVVVLSARAGEEARVEGLERGANDYLVKPFSARELIARVQAQLAASELRRVEALARAEAERANRAKDEFLAILGHELRNPLAPILTALDILQMREPVATRELEIIERQAHHLVRLVDDLLDVSRITQGKVELHKRHVELAQVVARAIETASPLFEQRRHELAVDVAPLGLVVNADPDRLAQVIANLLTNAAKYTEHGGRVTVAARRDGDNIALSVRDTGIGIAPEMLPHVFEIFAQERQALDRSSGGLGLGLAIARSLVALHGGRVDVASDGRDRGSQFTVTLPAAETRTDAPLAAHVPAKPASATAVHRVLVVDDNVDAVEMLAMSLEMLGYDTRVAHDAPEALRVVSTFTPEIVLLDIGLPVMDGYELAGKLREMPGLAGVRLVAVTGYGQESDRRRAKSAGFDVHVVKPVTLDTVRGVFDELLS